MKTGARRPVQARNPRKKASTVKAKNLRVKSAPKSASVGRFLGTALGSLIPVPGMASITGELGKWAGNKIGTLLGLGDYDVKQNSISGHGFGALQVPAMHSTNDATIIRKREFVADIMSAPVAGAYNVSYYPINPGYDLLFPWLSNEALGYQEWTPLGIAFDFVSTTGYISGAASPNVGSVMMGVDYDSFDVNPFPDESSIRNIAGSTCGPSTDNQLHLVECAPRKNVLEKMFVRTQAIPGNQPPQFYDLGTLGIATTGQPTANQLLGQLYATVEIQLDKPTMKFLGNSALQGDSFDLTNNASPLGAATPDPENSLGGTIAAGSYRFPPNQNRGCYRVTLQCFGPPTPLTIAPVFQTFVNCQLQPQASDGFSVIRQFPTAATNTTQCCTTAVIKVTAQNASFIVAALNPFPLALGVFTVEQVDSELYP